MEHFNPHEYKFLTYPEYFWVLEANSFKEYEANLKKVLKENPDIYPEIAGFSFELIVGALFYMVGSSKQFNCFDYRPTMVGDNSNPDHGIDGFGLTWDYETNNPAPVAVQIKYTGFKGDGVSIEWGNFCSEVISKWMLNPTYRVIIVIPVEEEKANKALFPIKKRFDDLGIQVQVTCRKSINMQLENPLQWKKLRNLIF